MDNKDSLTTKQTMQTGVQDRYDSFALAYCTNGENGAKAARTTGYAENSARQTARRLLTIDYVQRRISEIQTELRANYAVTLDEVRQKLRRNDLQAQAKGDIQASTRCIELLGKTVAAFIDKTQSETTEEQAKLTDEKVKQAKEFAKWKLEQDLKDEQRLGAEIINKKTNKLKVVPYD